MRQHAWWLVVGGLALSGCSGSTNEPVTVTTLSSDDGTVLATMTGAVVVPDDAFVPDPCMGDLIPQPPVLADDLAALTKATSRTEGTSAMSLYSIQIGDYTPDLAVEGGSFLSPKKRAGTTTRQNYETTVTIIDTDSVGRAALADLLATVHAR